MKIYIGSILLIAGSAFGQDTVQTKTANTSPYTVGASLDLVDTDQLGDQTLNVGVSLDRQIADDVSVGGTIDYWSESTGTLADQSVTVSDFAIGVNGKMFFPIEGSDFRPYAGVGLALHRFEVSFAERTTGGETIDEYEEVYSDVEGELGADLAGGVLYQIKQNLDASGQVRFRNIVDEDVELDQLAFGAGLQYRM